MASAANKLNNLGMAKSQHQLDMEALQRGAMGGYKPLPPTTAPVAVEPPAQAGETPEEANVGDVQAVNLEKAKTDPGVAAKLNMMAKARAKFYGEGQ